METRLGHCLFILFYEWIWLFSLTSILGGTKAEVRCIPSCQLPLVAAFPRELSALDLDLFGEAPAEEVDGFYARSPGARATAAGEEKHNVAGLTTSGESSKVDSRSRGNKTSCTQKDASCEQQKLSHSEVFIVPFPDNPSENNTGDARRVYGEDEERVDVTVEEDEERVDVTVEEDVAGWRRTRRSAAETWSGFRPQGEDEGSFSDQEEFQLTSSTFALSGDTAHNQAMVHWSGQNSSVSFLDVRQVLRTKLVWRSVVIGLFLGKFKVRVLTVNQTHLHLHFTQSPLWFNDLLWGLNLSPWGP